eukprot:8976180-Alexandrium_andersonii.AAC.1
MAISFLNCEAAVGDAMGHAGSPWSERVRLVGVPGHRSPRGASMAVSLPQAREGPTRICSGVRP